jgi:hypothetical protein
MDSYLTKQIINYIKKVFTDIKEFKFVKQQCTNDLIYINHPNHGNTALWQLCDKCDKKAIQKSCPQYQINNNAKIKKSDRLFFFIFLLILIIMGDCFYFFFYSDISLYNIISSNFIINSIDQQQKMSIFIFITSTSIITVFILTIIILCLLYF